MVVKFTIYGCGGTFSEQPLKQIFKHFNFFEVLVKFPWQQRTNIFRVDKIAKSVFRNKLMKNLFREKNYLNFFSKFWAKFFCYWRKITGMVVEIAIYVSFQGFEGKHLFLKIEHDFNILRSLRWKKWVSQSKIFFQVSTNKDSRFQRKILLKKDISFEKVFFFCYHFWSFSNFFSFCKVV